MSGLLINMYLKQHMVVEKRIDHVGGVWHVKTPTKHVECTDGFRMSVQVGENNYCSPKDYFAPWYDTAEVWNCNLPVPEFEPYGDGDAPYGYVPVELIDTIILQHGDIREQVNSEVATVALPDINEGT